MSEILHSNNINAQPAAFGFFKKNKYDLETEIFVNKRPK